MLLFVMMQIETKGENVCLLLISNLITEQWILCLVSIELVSCTHFRICVRLFIFGLSERKPLMSISSAVFCYGKEQVKWMQLLN